MTHYYGVNLHESPWSTGGGIRWSDGRGNRVSINVNDFHTPVMGAYPIYGGVPPMGYYGAAPVIYRTQPAFVATQPPMVPFPEDGVIVNAANGHGPDGFPLDQHGRELSDEGKFVNLLTRAELDHNPQEKDAAIHFAREHGLIGDDQRIHFHHTYGFATGNGRVQVMDFRNKKNMFNRHGFKAEELDVYMREQGAAIAQYMPAGVSAQPGAAGQGTAQGQGQTNNGNSGASIAPTQAGAALMADLDRANKAIDALPQGQTKFEDLAQIYNPNQLKSLVPDLQAANPQERTAYLQGLDASIDKFYSHLPADQQQDPNNQKALSQFHDIMHQEADKLSATPTQQQQATVDEHKRIDTLTAMADTAIDPQKFLKADGSPDTDAYEKAVDAYKGTVAQEDGLMKAGPFMGFFMQVISWLTHIGHPELNSPEAYLESLDKDGKLTPQGQEDLKTLKAGKLPETASQTDAPAADKTKTAGADGDPSKAAPAPGNAAVPPAADDKSAPDPAALLKKEDTSVASAATTAAKVAPADINSMYAQMAALGYDDLKGHAPGKPGPAMRKDVSDLEGRLGIQDSHGVVTDQLVAALAAVKAHPDLQDALRTQITGGQNVDAAAAAAGGKQKTAGPAQAQH